MVRSDHLKCPCLRENMHLGLSRTSGLFCLAQGPSVWLCMLALHPLGDLSDMPLSVYNMCASCLC